MACLQFGLIILLKVQFIFGIFTTTFSSVSTNVRKCFFVCEHPADIAEMEVPHFMQKPPISLPGINTSELDVDGLDYKEGAGGQAEQKEKEMGINRVSVRDRWEDRQRGKMNGQRENKSSEVKVRDRYKVSER